MSQPAPETPVAESRSPVLRALLALVGLLYAAGLGYACWDTLSRLIAYGYWSSTGWWIDIVLAGAFASISLFLAIAATYAKGMLFTFVKFAGFIGLFFIVLLLAALFGRAH